MAGSDTAATAAEAGRRADARRNRDLVLAAAREAFTDNGIDTSLRDVARRAGVGIGTLYRHFPTREALLEALLRHGFDDLRASAEGLLDADDPGEALFAWLRQLAVGANAYQGVPESVLAALNVEGSQMYGSCRAMHAAAAALLARAQQAGAVRPDVTPDEAFALATAVAWAGERTCGGPEVTGRLLDLLRTGLRV